MARTTVVKSARKDQGSCQSPRCTHEDRAIRTGASYKWFKRKSSYGGTVFKYHADCSIPQSHRTTSRMGEIYDAQDDAEGAIPSEPEKDTSSLKEIASSFADTVQGVSEGYNESADNIEEGFGHSTYQSDELRERAEALESWAGDLQDIDFDTFDEPENDAYERLSQDDGESDEDYEARILEEHEQAVEEARAEWWEEQVSRLTDEIQNCPC